MTKELTIIKLGGSVITNKNRPYVARKKVIQRLAREIQKAHMSVLIVHGSGSFGHTSASKYGGIHGYTNKWGIAKVARDAMAINAIVRDVFLDEQLPVISLSPMSMIISKEGVLYDSFFYPIKHVLNQNLIPLLYGDGIWDEEWNSTIFSGERVITELIPFLLSQHFVIKKVIEVGNTNGVYDLTGKTIPVITENTLIYQLESIKGSFSKDVTGGMQHKVQEALKQSKIGVQTQIINGEIPGELLCCLQGKLTKGTTICLRG